MTGGVRNSDPDTSRKASRSNGLSTLRTALFWFLCEQGNRGATKFEAMLHFTHLYPDSALDSWSPRFKELIDRGLVDYSTETRTSIVYNLVGHQKRTKESMVYKAKQQYWELPTFLLPIPNN
jgi:hypothetical protein